MHHRIIGASSPQMQSVWTNDWTAAQTIWLPRRFSELCCARRPAPHND